MAHVGSPAPILRTAAEPGSGAADDRAGAPAFTRRSPRRARPGPSRRAAQRQRDEIDDKLRRVRSEEAEIKQKSALFWQAAAARNDRRKSSGSTGSSRSRRYASGAACSNCATKSHRNARSTAWRRFELLREHHENTKLLHEEDLTRLLGDLRQQKPGLLIQVRELQAGSPAARERRQRGSTLQADCLIDWITLRAVTGQEASAMSTRRRRQAPQPMRAPTFRRC